MPKAHTLAEKIDILERKIFNTIANYKQAVKDKRGFDKAIKNKMDVNECGGIARLQERARNEGIYIDILTRLYEEQVERLEALQNN
jgi:hypothetical protein